MQDAVKFLSEDSLRILNEPRPLSEQLSFLHDLLRQRCPFVDRIAVALHDDKTDLLKTYIYSSRTRSPLIHYQARLAEVPSLRELVASRRARVINNLDIYADHTSPHAQRLQEFGSSYTLPVFTRERLLGFIFFNSLAKGVFQPEQLHHLDLFAHLLGLMIISERNSTETLTAAVKTTTDIAQQRDPEMGNHLERMSRYARLIALELAEELRLDDEFIEHLFLFAPLHDVGKVGIPDSILLKKGPLTAEEYAVMKTHTVKGKEIIDQLLANFRLGDLGCHRMLRNIAEFHHEAMDGTGYPSGIAGEAIPLEARIVAAADVFDALTSRRPYKDAWDNQRAFATLLEVAGTQLDPACVDALLRRKEEVEEIQRLFREDYFG
jgi:HD-GYP domain-containing protein (c-di-GMP phosphodiesterase class II)